MDLECLKKKVGHINGRFSPIVNGDDICTVARGVNLNAEILEDVIGELIEINKKLNKLDKENNYEIYR